MSTHGVNRLSDADFRTEAYLQKVYDQLQTADDSEKLALFRQAEEIVNIDVALRDTFLFKEMQEIYNQAQARLNSSASEASSSSSVVYRFFNGAVGGLTHLFRGIVLSEPTPDKKKPTGQKTGNDEISDLIEDGFDGQSSDLYTARDEDQDLQDAIDASLENDESHLLSREELERRGFLPPEEETPRASVAQDSAAAGSSRAPSRQPSGSAVASLAAKPSQSSAPKAARSYHSAISLDRSPYESHERARVHEECPFTDVTPLGANGQAKLTDDQTSPSRQPTARSATEKDRSSLSSQAYVSDRYLDPMSNRLIPTPCQILLDGIYYNKYTFVLNLLKTYPNDPRFPIVQNVRMMNSLLLEVLKSVGIDKKDFLELDSPIPATVPASTIYQKRIQKLLAMLENKYGRSSDIFKIFRDYSSD